MYREQPAPACIPLPNVHWAFRTCFRVGAAPHMLPRISADDDYPNLGVKVRVWHYYYRVMVTHHSPMATFEAVRAAPRPALWVRGVD